MCGAQLVQPWRCSERAELRRFGPTDQNARKSAGSALTLGPCSPLLPGNYISRTGSVLNTCVKLQPCKLLHVLTRCVLTRTLREVHERLALAYRGGIGSNTDLCLTRHICFIPLSIKASCVHEGETLKYKANKLT